MKWEEIRKQFAGQWVLIEYKQLDEQLNVVEGEVIAHSPAKVEIYKHLLKTDGRNIGCRVRNSMPFLNSTRIDRKPFATTPRGIALAVG